MAAPFVDKDRYEKIMKLSAKGLTDKVIAERLGITTRTVQRYRTGK